ncbi:MAG: hypothetical protein JXA82_09375 [Sedimentisphaerales bacterium]|nr:hypothetical protein [Sedimentisphaerales bacterium]
MSKPWKAVCIVVLVIAGIVIANQSNQGDGINITISPNTLVLDNDGGSVSVHTNIPFGSVNTDTVFLEGITPYLCKADSLGDLVVKVDTADVKAIVSPGQVTLTLTGKLIDGDIPFQASDTITVK